MEWNHRTSYVIVIQVINYYGKLVASSVDLCKWIKTKKGYIIYIYNKTYSSLDRQSYNISKINLLTYQ